MDLVLNNLQWLICHKNQPTNQTLSNDFQYLSMRFYSKDPLQGILIQEPFPKNASIKALSNTFYNKTLSSAFL